MAAETTARTETPPPSVPPVSWNTLLLDNPILVKHIRARLRPQQLWPLVAGVFIVGAIIMYACVRLNGVGNGIAFSIFTGFQALILFLFGTSQVATAVSQARESGILDFHRVSPVRPTALTLGFILGAPIREWVLALTLLPFSIMCLAWAAPGPIGLLKALVVMVTTAVLYHAMAALAGVTVKPRNVRGVGGGAVVIVVLLNMFGVWPLTVFPTILEVLWRNFGTLFGPGDMPDFLLHPVFYSVPLSHFVITLIHELPLTVFLFIGTMRKLESEQAFLFTKPLAVAFLLLISFYTLGDLYSVRSLRDLEQAGIGQIIVAYIVTIVAVGLAWAVTPGWGAFANGIRRARKGGAIRPPAWTDLASNGIAVFVLALIAAGTVLVANQMAGEAHTSIRPAARMAALAACTVVFFGAACQATELKYRRSGRGYFALLLFVLWIIPLLLGMVAAITDAEESAIAGLFALSPLGGLGITGMPDSMPQAHAAPFIALGIGILWAALFTILRLAAERNAESAATQPH